MRPRQLATALCLTTIALATLVGLRLAPASARAPDSVVAADCPPWRHVPSVGVTPVAPTAQVVRVFSALQADLTTFVYNAPTLELAVRRGLEATADAHLDRGVVEVTSALQDTPLEDDELYAVLAHEAFHHVLHGPHARRCNHLMTDHQLQQDELEADAQTGWLLRQAGRDASALKTVLVKLGVGSEPTSGRNTHPSIEARLRVAAW